MFALLRRVFTGSRLPKAEAKRLAAGSIKITTAFAELVETYPMTQPFLSGLDRIVSAAQSAAILTALLLAASLTKALGAENASQRKNELLDCAASLNAIALVQAYWPSVPAEAKKATIQLEFKERDFLVKQLNAIEPRKDWEGRAVVLGLKKAKKFADAKPGMEMKNAITELFNNGSKCLRRFPLKE